MMSELASDQFRHCYSVQVRWGDMDALAHVNNVSFFRYLECARVDYIQTVIQHFLTQRYVFILARAACDFKVQVRYPDTIKVYSRVSNMGRASMELSHVLLNQQRTTVAQASSTMVFFDTETQRPSLIPDEFRAKIAAFDGLLSTK